TRAPPLARARAGEADLFAGSGPIPRGPALSPASVPRAPRATPQGLPSGPTSPAPPGRQRRSRRRCDVIDAPGHPGHRTVVAADRGEAAAGAGRADRPVAAVDGSGPVRA